MEAARVVYLVGAQPGPEEFLEEIVGLHRGPGRTHAVNGLGAGFFTDFLKFPGHQVQGFVPAGLTEAAVFFDKRGLEAVFGFHHRKGKAAPAAQEDRIFVHHPEDLAVFDVHLVGATATAEGADHVGLVHFPGPGPIFKLFVDERAHRADVDTGAAEFAVQGHQPRAQLGEIPPVHEIDGHSPHVVPADAHAAATGDAAVRMALDQIGLVIVVGRQRQGLEVHLVHAQDMSQFLELAFAALVADGAFQGMVDEHQLHEFLADGLDARGIGHHFLPLGHIGGASRKRPGRAGFDFHHANAAGADGLQSRVIAHIGDEDAVFLGYFQDGFPWLRLYGPAVDGQINHKSILLWAVTLILILS